MTTTAYKRIKALLIEQRRQVTRSPKAASQLITDLGIRDILVEEPPPKEKSCCKESRSQKICS